MLNAQAESVSVCTEQLARFFPEAQPVKVQAVLMPLRSGVGTVRELVLVEFASSEKAIFSSGLPLEFDDRVRLARSVDDLGCAARVVALQYHHGRKAVAVQFAAGQGSWVKKS